jgi:hypothetical protein
VAVKEEERMAELTVTVPIKGRDVEMRKPTDGALVVLARITRTLPKTKIENGDATPEYMDKLVRNLGTVGSIVEAMIVTDDDKDWLDEVMVSGAVTAEDIFDAIRVAGEKFNGPGAPAGPVKQAAVRRRAR